MPNPEHDEDFDDVVEPITHDNSDDDLDIIEVDDTPEPDRDKAPLPYDPTDEEHTRNDADFGDGARRRIAEMTKARHDERRAREASDRERDAAVEYARKLVSELKTARANAASGEQAYVAQIQANTNHEFEKAQKAVADAYEEGNPAAVAAAQAALTKIAVRQAAVDNYVPPVEDPDDETYNYTPPAPAKPAAPAGPSESTRQWVDKNPWFHKDQAMTTAALQVHQELYNDGVVPDSPRYFREIDQAMRTKFPTYSWGGSKAGPSTPPVAGVRAPQTGARRTVNVTKAEVALCKRLGITTKDFVREKLLLEGKK
jgi:hypothetical protein